MKILADENLKNVELLFAKYGEVQLIAGRDIDDTTVIDADVLLVRSVTRVDEVLLGGSQVKFVGSATSGVEHVDEEYLQRCGIHFAHAKGSNAAAVAQYCISALCHAADAGNFDFDNDSVGIVGCGYVGKQLAHLLRALDIPVYVYDPLLSSYDKKLLTDLGLQFASVEEIFDCAAVSLHVPLTRHGKLATFGMVNKSLLSRLKPKSTLINACRGGVVDESSLKECLLEMPEIFAAIDVWENEPLVEKELLRRANIATPHIAGYSANAKTSATHLLLCQYIEDYLGLDAKGRSLPIATDLSTQEIIGCNVQNLLMQALPLGEISESFKAKTFAAEPSSSALVFDAFRKSMINRREFSNFSVKCPDINTRQRQQLSLLGFKG